MNLNIIRNTCLAMALWSARRPKLAIGLVLLLTVVFGLGLHQLRVDASNSALFKANDPAQMAYQKFQKDFGREDAVVLAIESDRIFSADFMRQLRALHLQLEAQVPWTQEVTSLVNTTYFDQADGVLRSSKLGERWPASGQVDAALKKDILSNSLYKRRLLSPEGTMTLLIIRPQTRVTPAELAAHSGQSPAPQGLHDKVQAFFAKKAATAQMQESAAKTAAASEEALFGDIDAAAKPAAVSANEDAAVGLPPQQMAEFLAAIEAIVKTQRDAGMQMYVSGEPVINHAHQEQIHQGAVAIVGLSILVVMVVLAIQLRSVVGVVLPIGVMLLTIVCTLGLMGWIGFPVSGVSQALPPILLTMGVMSSVHLLTHFLQSSEPDFETAVRDMFEHSGDPVVYTILTDILAFLAFTVASLQPIAEFGWMAAFGAALGLVFTIILLPAVLRLVPVPRRRASQMKFFDAITALVLPVGVLSSKHYKWVLAAVVLLVALVVPGLGKIQYAHDIMTWFQPTHPVRVATLETDKAMQAIVPLEIIIDTGHEGGVVTPEFMHNLALLQAYCNSLSAGALQVGSTTSIVDSIAQIHQVLTDKKAGALPATQSLLQQEMIFYEGAGGRDLLKLTDRGYTKARVTMRFAWADGHAFVGLDEKIKIKVTALFGTGVTTTVTGSAFMQSKGALDVIDGMWSSYLLAAGLIAIMLMLVLRDFKVSLASMVPNFLPVCIGLAVMGYFALPVDMFMVLLGDIALAVSVDDTVHFMHTALRHRKKTGSDITSAIRHTIRDVGAPLVVAGIAMACCFYTFAFSSIPPLSRLGVVLGSVLLLALVLDLIVSPALITAVSKLERQKQPDASLPNTASSNTASTHTVLPDNFSPVNTSS
jgi:uncharacterized protein